MENVESTQAISGKSFSKEKMNDSIKNENCNHLFIQNIDTVHLMQVYSIPFVN